MSKLSVETEYDKAVDAVATSLADCELKKKYGSCSEADCAHCDMKAYQNMCMKSFADVDKIRVYNKLQRDLAQRDSSEECITGWEAFKAQLYFSWHNTYLPALKYILTWIISILVILILPTTCLTKLYGQSLSDYDYTRYALTGEPGYVGKYRKNILDTLDKTQKYLRDVNNDGELNCIDYSCIFKILWDKQFDPENCEIVRNKSSTMNHLFIRVRQYHGKPWECIEPQAARKDITRYFMEDFWLSTQYNPIYNVYGETDLWLKEVKNGN